VEEADRFEEMLRLWREGKISEDEFRRFRLQQGTYSSRFQPNFSMVRVKVPGGEVNPEQLNKIAELSEIFSIGSAHVTTRENFQLHWVYLDDVPLVLRELAKVGLTTREACGNTIRNITCHPFSGVCPYEPFNVLPYTKALAKFFLRNPLNQNLPRKFKINFSCCEYHGLARIGDIGLIPHIKEDKKGFQIFIGGGLGPASYLGELLEEFTPEEDLIFTCIAVVRLYDRLGDREKMHRNRMRYLIQDVGFEKFKRMVLKERTIIKATFNISLEPFEEDVKEEEFGEFGEDFRDEDYKKWFLTCVMPQKQRGFYLVGINLPAGDISSEQLRGLSGICDKYSLEKKVRLTPNQSIIIRWVKSKDLYNLYLELSSLGLNRLGAFTIANVVGCSGTTSCNLAITNSHRLAKEIQSRLLNLHDGFKNSSIKISGCPNSCGQHMIATLGFYGGGSRINGVQAPTYQMLLGGRASGKRAKLGINFMRVPAKRVIEVILKMIDLYNSTKKGEEFDEWIDNIIEGRGPNAVKNLDELKKHLEPLVVIPTIDKEPEAYIDWGNEEKFRAKTARGECAA